LEIILHQISKKFVNDKIFKDLNLHVSHQSKVAILGNNGSGKSTLLQILAGYRSVNAGKVEWKFENDAVSKEKVFTKIVLASPFQELIEDFTLSEIIDFHLNFKKTSFTKKEILTLPDIKLSENKPIKFFSSGMRQRVKLLLAIIADVDTYFFDEPTTNLDQSGIEWYQYLITNFLSKKTIIVASNNLEEEIKFTNTRYLIENYKVKEI
jgi:ABC-type multidrug transport system ATPase subunit